MFNPSFRIGRQGVEKALDTSLRGEPGGNRVEVDARGRVVAEDIGGSRPAVPGKDVVLTLDADVQNRALEVFGDESGACVVMDVRNGDILSDNEAYAGKKLNEVFPANYAAKAQAAGKTRAQVQAELAEAIRTGDIQGNGDRSEPLNVLFPHRYPRSAPVSASLKPLK